MHFISSDSPLPDGALVLDNTADVLAQAGSLPGHPAVVLHFPKWTDGRAYSQAVLLRGRLRYAGSVVATGQVLVDMLPLLQRCGFDAVQLRADQQIAHAREALGFFGSHYQTVPPERAPAAGAAPAACAPHANAHGQAPARNAAHGGVPASAATASEAAA
jgi:uncharacterized protein (DUF934 family)